MMKIKKQKAQKSVSLKENLNSFDSIDLIESYAHRTSKDLEGRKEEIRYITI